MGGPLAEKLLDRKTLAQPTAITIVPPKPARTEASTADFLNYYKNKIRCLGRYIISRLDEPPVSVNKITRGRNTILGLVREPAGKEFVVEDMTGRCRVVAKTPEDVAENDVIAVTGSFTGEKMFAEKISSPDMAIKKEIKTSAQETVFFFLSADDADTAVRNVLAAYPAGQKFLFVSRGGEAGAWVFCSSGSSVTEKIRAPDASKIFVESGGANFKIQNFRTTLTTAIEEQAKHFAKRRYVGGAELAPGFDEDPRVIDDDADIIFLGTTGSAGAANHKGYTFIVAGAAGEAVAINTLSRKADLLNL